MTRASLIITFLATAGCSQSLGNLSTLGAASVHAPAPSGPRIRGKSCSHWILGLPMGAPSLEDATRAAQRQTGGATLEEVEVKKSFWSTVLYGQECLVVEARAAITTEESP